MEVKLIVNYAISKHDGEKYNWHLKAVILSFENVRKVSNDAVENSIREIEKRHAFEVREMSQLK